MAAPTPVTYERQIGHAGFTTWEGHWTGTGDFTAGIIVDVSGLTTYTTSLKVFDFFIVSTAGIEVEIEFDCTSNQDILLAPEGVGGPVYYDFRGLPDGGLTKTNAGSTGDIVLTTTGAASGDRVFIMINWYVN
jgi:hypothetical protein